MKNLEQESIWTNKARATRDGVMVGALISLLHHVSPATIDTALVDALVLTLGVSTTPEAREAFQINIPKKYFAELFKPILKP